MPYILNVVLQYTICDKREGLELKAASGLS
jgi:hypothetical protein